MRIALGFVLLSPTYNYTQEKIMIIDKYGSGSSRSVIDWLLIIVMATAISYLPLSSVIATSSNELTRFKHPTGVFTLSIPKNWGSGVPFQANPNVFTFKPSSSSEFTVSITQNLKLPSELPMTTVEFMFPDETPISKPIREKGNGWNSISQDFERKIAGKTWVWLAKFYGFRTNDIAINFNDTKENIDKFRALFEAVTNSIEFHEEQ